MDFVAWPKTPRLSKAFWVTITEKLDGTNAQITIVDGKIVSVGSRTRFITPGKLTDNYGFAGWVERNTDELLKLGDGTHYGEWYGNGIQRGYGLDEKRFALFNPLRYRGALDARNAGHPQAFPDCVETVPVLFTGQFNADVVNQMMDLLRTQGSLAVPGYMNPEGLIVDMHGVRAKHTFEHVDGKWLADQPAA